MGSCSVVISGHLLIKSVINSSTPFLLLGVMVLVWGRDIVVPMRSVGGGENNVIRTEGVEGPVVTIAWMGGGSGLTLLILKGRGDMRDTERPASSLPEERREDVFQGVGGQGPEVGDGMISASGLRVLTREAHGVEGRKDSSSSSIEGVLKKHIPCSSVGVVVVMGCK